MKYIIIFLWFLFNLNYAYSDTISYETVAESEILPQNAIYKVDNDFYFSIKIDLKDGWKTYWKNPGDAGLPIEINWGENSKKVDHEILFPFPQKYLSNDVLTIGYENEVVFIVKIKLNDLTDNIKQKLKLNYLVCEDICIPISEEKTIDLNFKNIKNSSDFINSYNKIPKKINYEDIAEKEILSPKKVRLFVKPNLEFSNDKIFIFSEESNLTLENFERNTGILDILSDKPINQLTKSILISYETKNDFEEVVIKLDDLKPKKSLFYFCILAFFGGLILNFMPCVLPVLSLKILSFSSLIEKKKKLIRLSSLNITFGIISSFLILGLLVVLFKYFGTEVGWGFHFQNKVFIAAITLIIFLFSLNMLGYFEFFLPQSMNEKFNNLIDKNKIYTDYLSGIFATLLATPCSAPFLGTAVGFSMIGSSETILIIFFFISIGFSLPYLLCFFFPNIVNIFPKPGKWMMQFKFFLGILLLITTGWLLKLLDFNLFLILCMLSLILILSIIKGKSSKFKTITSVIFSAIFITTSILVIDKKSAVWEQFNESDIISYVNSGEIVLLDVTADWCITCQMNKITTLNSGRIVKIFRENNIKLQRADWTERDPHILEFISKYGRYGIPVNIIYSKNNTEGILLPEILSQDILREELRKVINEN